MAREVMELDEDTLGSLQPGRRQLYLTRPYLEGPDVLAVQRRLQELGFDPQVIDGLFGPITEEAVAAFQRSRRLEPNGVVDDRTFRALGFAAPGPTPPAPGGPWGRPKEISILIDTGARRMTVYSGRQVLRVYPVAVGKPSTPTPPGDWRIMTKIVNPDWNALGTRWMGLSIPHGNYGIHGTNNPASIGHAVSNGCIRLHNENVEELFEWARIGTPVRIVRGGGSGQPQPPGGQDGNRGGQDGNGGGQGGNRGSQGGNRGGQGGSGSGEGGRPVLSRGSSGSDVVDLQNRLRQLGLYSGPVDGRFGPATEAAVRAFQQSRGLAVDGIVGPATWRALGSG